MPVFEGSACCATGAASFGEGLVALAPRLRSYAIVLARNRDLADDLVQDTLLRAWGAREQFVEGSSLKAWTFTILRNAFLSQRRRARFVGELDEAAAARLLSQPPHQGQALELEEVGAFFADLSVEQRQALKMIALDELSYHEAAERCGVASGTLKSRVCRARKALQLASTTLGGGGAAKRPQTRAAATVKRTRPSVAVRAARAARADGKPLWIG